MVTEPMGGEPLYRYLFAKTSAACGVTPSDAAHIHSDLLPAVTQTPHPTVNSALLGFMQNGEPSVFLLLDFFNSEFHIK